ncbi:MAG TPA: hypothetical protein PK629_12090, partial [Oscillospiraceae bacterium]|nr:hypothetical protein [Oscillospiraceae bacterium]HPK35908.1 hypothetical protein [Oscillospiraceae bacterium]
NKNIPVARPGCFLFEVLIAGLEPFKSEQLRSRCFTLHQRKLFRPCGRDFFIYILQDLNLQVRTAAKQVFYPAPNKRIPVIRHIEFPKHFQFHMMD